MTKPMSLKSAADGKGYTMMGRTIISGVLFMSQLDGPPLRWADGRSGTGKIPGFLMNHSGM